MTPDTKNRGLEKLLNLEEVADKLGVHRTTVSRYVYANELPCIPLGKRLMFDPADVRKFLKNRKKLFENRVSQGCVMGKG